MPIGGEIEKKGEPVFSSMKEVCLDLAPFRWILFLLFYSPSSRIGEELSSLEPVFRLLLQACIYFKRAWAGIEKEERKAILREFSLQSRHFVPEHTHGV